MTKEPYRQTLPALDLSLERYTDAVPADGAWYVLRAGEEIGRFRTKAEAQAAWKEVVAASGWTPPRRGIDASETLRRERAARWARNRGG